MFYWRWSFIVSLVLIVVPSSIVQAAPIAFPALSLGVDSTTDPERIALSLQILFLLSVLSLAPAILMMTTSFIRIAIVLSFARTALALQQMPPTQVMMALALFLTLFVMMPTFNSIYEDAYLPFQQKEIGLSDFYDRAVTPIRQFMFDQIGSNNRDILVPFIQMGNIPWPKTQADVPTYVLIPAFMLNEMKRAFYMGILIFIPFLIIDMVVASVLMSMGMIMLPPVMVSLPFKIILFVMLDGWNLLVTELMKSFFV